MPDWVERVAVAVPGLLVLSWITWKFVTAMSAQTKLFAASIEQAHKETREAGTEAWAAAQTAIDKLAETSDTCHEVQSQSREAVAQNTMVLTRVDGTLGRVEVALNRSNGAR